ncbi:probable D-aspartate oxidase [Phialocephala subalpina]|uniref:Probable D-aspartate oxidase n=1 Tax=Phialocephala subalpina TaxID=576137 RepID=A0A1L7XF45_9HELO|nr:probable D-aspartate oxidase [Phialocephala subalpina]
MPKKETIVVVGAGILGLTSALRIQERADSKTEILIVAREFPSDRSIDYASPWAGAHYRPIPATTPQDIKEHALSRVTYQLLKQEAAVEPAAGIIFLDGFDYLQTPSDAYVELRGGYAEIDGFRLLEKAELPEGSVWGAKYRTWCLNSPVYCAHLLRKFVLKGGKTKRHRLNSIEEAFSMASDINTVVNCSGFGFGDPNVFTTRGQTCLVSNPCDRTITQQNSDGSWSFVIPRPLHGGTIVGGTKEPNDWTSEVSLETRDVILQRVATMFPQILNAEGKFDVVEDIVGRRPTRRGGLRLEVEWVGEADASRKIVHAYGAGGRGYELSWGVAKEVVELVYGDKTSKMKSSL